MVSSDSIVTGTVVSYSVGRGKEQKENLCDEFCAIYTSVSASLSNSVKPPYIEDITRLREDMDFMFEWQEQYLTSERSERVRYCSCHENIKSISLSCRVMFFLLYGRFECS